MPPLPTQMRHVGRVPPPWVPPARAGRGRAPQYIVLLALLGAALYFGSGWIAPGPRVWSTCPRKMALMLSRGGWLLGFEFERLRDAVLNGSAEGWRPLEGEHYGYTAGHVIKFNTEGIDGFRHHPNYSTLRPLFDKAFLQVTNAFVITIMSTAQPPVGTPEAIGAHMTHGLDLDSKDIFLPTQVDILYVSVPEGVEGGELEVWPRHAKETEKYRMVAFPVENFHVAFRGDAFHRLRRFSSNSVRPIVWVQMEQYMLQRRHYGMTKNFCDGAACSDAG